MTENQETQDKLTNEFEKLVLNESHRTDFKHEHLPLLNEKGDVILVHDPHDLFCCYTNVPRYGRTTATQHTWGYTGGGPTGLAWDILYHFTKNAKFTCNYHIDFRDAVLANRANRYDHVINQEIIDAFIAEKMNLESAKKNLAPKGGVE